MAFLDRITSNTARNNADLIRTFLDPVTQNHLSTLLTKLENEVPKIVYQKQRNLMLARNKYTMQREMRKRNWIYRTVRPFEDKYDASKTFIGLFEKTDPELIEQLEVINTLLSGIRNNYKGKKYNTKKEAHSQNLLTVQSTTENDFKSLLADIREFFAPTVSEAGATDLATEDTGGLA